MKKSLSAESLHYSLTSASKEIPSRIVCMSTMCGMMMTAEEFPVRLHHLIMVNHWGTIILAEPLELPDDGRRYIDEETDWNYDPFGGAEKNQKPCVTVGEFMNQYLNR